MSRWKESVLWLALALMLAASISLWLTATSMIDANRVLHERVVELESRPVQYIETRVDDHLIRTWRGPDHGIVEWYRLHRESLREWEN